MKKIITTFTSIFLAIVVLVSTMSFTVNIRYCDDNLIVSTLNLDNDSCQEITLIDVENCCIPKEDCCQDAEIIFKGQEEIRIIAIQKLKSNSFVPLAMSVKYTFALKTTCTLKSSTYKPQLPPFIRKKQYLFHQLFLI